MPYGLRLNSNRIASPPNSWRRALWVCAAASTAISLTVPWLGAQEPRHALHNVIPASPAFDSAAAAIWREQLGANDTLPLDTVFSARIARLAGLEFQAKADRLTPDLDSALARSVMAGGKLRESPWGQVAFARESQAHEGSCTPLHSTSPRDWYFHCRQVAGALRRALALDSGFAPAIAELDRMIPWPELWAEPETEYQNHLVADSFIGLPEALRRKLSRRTFLLQMELEQPTILSAELEAVSGSLFTEGEHAFLQSRIDGLSGDGPRALAAYVSAASSTDAGEQAKWIEQDIGLIGTPEELEGWHALHPSQRGSWIEELWASRDFRDGLMRGGRLVKHAERWRKAFHEYRYLQEDLRLRGMSRGSENESGCSSEIADSSLGRLVAWCNLPPGFQRNSVFDDRGLTLLRHGEPQQRANYPGQQQFSYESWLYQLADGPRVIHFYKPQSSPLIGMIAKPLAGGDWMTTCQITPRYCVLASRKALGERIPPERMQMVMERGAEEMREILTTDEAIQRFHDPLPHQRPERRPRIERQPDHGGRRGAARVAPQAGRQCQPGDAPVAAPREGSRPGRGRERGPTARGGAAGTDAGRQGEGDRRHPGRRADRARRAARRPAGAVRHPGTGRGALSPGGRDGVGGRTDRGSPT